MTPAPGPARPRASSWGTRRALPLVLLPVGLACAGLATPTARVDRRAVSIELLAGDVTEDADHGSSGDHDVEIGGTTQALSWTPLDEEPLDEELGRLYRAFRQILPDTDLGGPPAHADLRLGDGVPGRGFTVTAPPVELHVAVWLCEGAGVRVQLVTSGITGLARQLHERSLASAACGALPVGAETRPHAWRFVDPSGWSSEAGATSAEGELVPWTRDDRAVALDVRSTSPWVDPDVPALCIGTLKLWHGEFADDITFDEAHTRFLPTPGGCVHTWAGTDPADGARMSGRVEAQTCGERGYTVACFVHAPDLGPEACAGLLACAE